MKKIIIIIFFISNNYGQEKLFNHFELFIGTKNHNSQTDSFSLDKIGVNWNNATNNYLITDDFNPGVLTISGDAIEPSFSFGLDWVNSNQGGEPPFYGGVFTYGFYKFWTSDAYFYLDYRDCRFQDSSTPPYSFVIDLFFVYNGTNNSFSFFPSTTAYNEMTITNGNILRIWDAFDEILEVGAPTTSCFETFWQNCLVIGTYIYQPLQIVWGPNPDQSNISKYYLYRKIDNQSFIKIGEFNNQTFYYRDKSILFTEYGSLTVSQ